MSVSKKFKLSDYLLGIVVICAILAYLGWRLFFTLPLNFGMLALVLGIIFFLAEAFSGFEIIMHYYFMMRPAKVVLPTIPAAWFPDVDVLITTHDEDVELLHGTVNACLYLDYPDKSKVHIYLCDDTLRDEVRELAERMGVGYIGMEPSPHAKAGNINNALEHTSSPLVAFLDADMVPKRQFLMRTIPYFSLPKVRQNQQGEWIERKPEEIDPEYKVGFVQTPQNFYHPDLFQYNLYAEPRIPSEQMYFFRIVNVGMNKTNSSILCGTNNIISREALDDIGLFGTGTITEDLHTGMLIQGAGYTTYATEEVLVNGMCPHSAIGLLRQRERWARGAMQVMYKVKPFLNGRYPLMTQISYLNIIIYWWTFIRRFIYVMSPILVAFFGIYIVDCSLWDILKFWLPYYILNTIALNKLTQGKRTAHWNNTFDTVLFPYLVVPVLLETVGIRMDKFYVTPKGHSKETSIPWLALPHITLLIMSVIGIVLCLVATIQSQWFYYLIILFWLAANSKNLLLSVFFMLGRSNERQQYRQAIEVPAEIEHNGYVYKGYTIDISSKGCALSLLFPACLHFNEPVTIQLCDGPYSAKLEGELIRVGRHKIGDWIYSFTVKKIEPDQLREFKQIIHDGDPNLPDTIDEVLPIVEDLTVNVDNRLRTRRNHAPRKLPRLLQTIEGKLEDGSPVTLKDFNYRFTRVYPPPSLQQNEVLRVRLGEGVEACLTTADEIPAAQSRGLFRVINWEDFAVRPEYVEKLASCAGALMPVAAENDESGPNPVRSA